VIAPDNSIRCSRPYLVLLCMMRGALSSTRYADQLSRVVTQRILLYPSRTQCNLICLSEHIVFLVESDFLTQTQARVSVASRADRSTRAHTRTACARAAAR
jgi:hypothetical protein